jgi:hypothetical protein
MLLSNFTLSYPFNMDERTQTADYFLDLVKENFQEAENLRSTLHVMVQGVGKTYRCGRRAPFSLKNWHR